jgi:D-arabinose 1-dehydrogenase-like Zn-dependent alcohol dehydrogenase
MAYNIYSTAPAYTYGNITLTTPNTSGSVYTIGAGANGTSAVDWSNTTWTTAPVTINKNASIDLKGEGADIVINGESLNETLKSIKDALRIPSRLPNLNPELEKDWEELKAAREHYDQLLKEYTEKQQVWDTLKTEDK